MIDWLTLRVYCECPVKAGAVYSIDADGVVEWRSEKRLPVEGSHSQKIYVRRFSYDDTLEISGNPAKFFQGHNLFGSDDMLGLSIAFVHAVLARLGYKLSPVEADCLQRGIAIVTRVDSTASWDVGSLPRALHFIRSLETRGHLKHRGRGSMSREGTVYWGKHSRRLAGKAYAKGQEIKDHKLPVDLANRDELIELAQGLVRVEWTFRSMWLKDRGLDVLQNWVTKAVTPQALHAELMADLTVTDATMIEASDLEKIPPSLRLIYGAWKRGTDLRRELPRSTFYKRRRQLLEHGIDIATVLPSDPESNVVPLRVVIHAQPLTVPSWAVGTPLYFEPSKLAA